MYPQENCALGRKKYATDGGDQGVKYELCLYTTKPLKTEIKIFQTTWILTINKHK